MDYIGVLINLINALRLQPWIHVLNCTDLYCLFLWLLGNAALIPELREAGYLNHYCSGVGG